MEEFMRRLCMAARGRPSAALDKLHQGQGLITAWNHVIVGQAIVKGSWWVLVGALLWPETIQGSSARIIWISQGKLSFPPFRKALIAINLIVFLPRASGTLTLAGWHCRVISMSPKLGFFGTCGRPVPLADACAVYSENWREV
ncbi:hypothetical protein [Acidovorax sp.]|uniref:hypothetical protein n=1 Tax=Acidovorax sp. TaxID=1872122 RepID=UPI00261B348B|nr:hypothetical protein [Acidovorax sp.]